MSSSLNKQVAAVVLSAAAALSAVGFAAAANATEDGMHGDPGAAAPYWRYQQQNRDCAEVAVADVVGEITGHEPGEDEINAVSRIPWRRPCAWQGTPRQADGDNVPGQRGAGSCEPAEGTGNARRTASSPSGASRSR